MISIFAITKNAKMKKYPEKYWEKIEHRINIFQGLRENSQKMTLCLHGPLKWQLYRKSAIRKCSFLTKSCFSPKLPCWLHSLGRIASQPHHHARCRLEVISTVWCHGSTLPPDHPSLSFTWGAGRYTVLFSLKTVFIGVAQLHVYFNDVRSVSFRLISSLFFALYVF